MPALWSFARALIVAPPASAAGGKSIRALGTSMDGLTCRPPDRTKRKSVPLRGGLDHAVANTTCLRVLRSRLRRPVDHVDADPHRGERRFRSSRSTDIPHAGPSQRVV